MDQNRCLKIHQALCYNKIKGKKKLYYTKRLTLWKPGSMLSESTTTTGDSLPVIHISPFHMMRADVSIKPERDHQKKI